MLRLTASQRHAVTALALLVAGAAHAQQQANEYPSAPIPAFTADELTALPSDNWHANGGNILNQRYSPLTQLNRDNIAGLKAEWRVSLGGSGVTPRGSNQAEPIYYDGTVYIATSENDVFAIDVDSGQIAWTYEAGIDPLVAQPCCGWAVRGLALGEGKVFMGRLDAELVALNQNTGAELWRTQVADPRERYSITSAPRYYNGLVITGTSGGVMGTRGRLDAYAADTGELVWRFYTVPGPGEFGHDTWPQDNEVWKYGGAAVWQTPAIDPALGLIYFSTSNPGPVQNGALRKGDNLFSSSIVALDVNTGAYRWHFQEVHHDIWDYDATNPIILFDAAYDGVMRKGLAQAGKTGFVYLLDRITGAPLIGIEEREVMQEPRQFTSPTQPFPIGDPLVPQSIDVEPEGFELVNLGRIFTPYYDKPVLWKPLAATNWPPSSYDPDKRLMYICSADSSWGATIDPDYPVVPTGPYAGGVVYPAPIGRRGVFTALDVTTNRIRWQQQWAEQCYSGSIATAGGLVFVGRNDGRLTALNSDEGSKLWEFQTDGGVNAPAITFERNGTQYVLAYAGGTSLAPSKRSDGVWLFSLGGQMTSLPRGSADPNGQFPRRVGGGPPGPAAEANNGPFVNTANRVPDIAAGRVLYATTCQTCHGQDGKGGAMGGKALTTALGLADIVSVVTNGRNTMPPFGALMPQTEIQDVAAYLVNELLRLNAP